MNHRSPLLEIPFGPRRYKASVADWHRLSAHLRVRRSLPARRASDWIDANLNVRGLL